MKVSKQYIGIKLLIVSSDEHEYNDDFFEKSLRTLDSPNKKVFSSLSEAKAFQLKNGKNYGIFEVKDHVILKLYLHPELSITAISNPTLPAPDPLIEESDINHRLNMK